MHDAFPTLIAYDASEPAKAAIADAARLLRPGRPAVVLTVWDFPAVSGFAPITADDSLRASVADEAARVAAEGVRIAKRVGFDASSETSQGDPTWERIVKAAEHHRSDLIVMGSHGRSGIAYALLGSVATAVLHHAPCPVLVSQGEDVAPSHSVTGAHVHTSPAMDTRKETE
jgi:nucleotide-binding universal stress UspA family protein